MTLSNEMLFNYCVMFYCDIITILDIISKMIYKKCFTSNITLNNGSFKSISINKLQQ